MKMKTTMKTQSKKVIEKKPVQPYVSPTGRGHQTKVATPDNQR